MDDSQAWGLRRRDPAGRPVLRVLVGPPASDFDAIGARALRRARSRASIADRARGIVALEFMDVGRTTLDFADYRREVLRQSLERQAGVFTLVLGIALALDAYRLHPSRAFATILGRLPLQIAACALAFVVLRATSIGARRPAAVGAFAYAVVAGIGGLLLGDLGGFDGPFFYGSYVLPTFVMVLPCSFGDRLTLTGAAVTAFVVAYFGPHPEHLGHPFAHIAVAYLAVITVVDLHFGHRGMLLLRERFEMQRADEARSAALEADNQRLEARVREQTGSVRGLLDRLDASRLETRTEVARDLHDGMGQLVVGTRLELQQIERALDTGERLSTEDLGYLYGLVDHLDKQVRDMVRSLREPGAIACIEDELQALIGSYTRPSGVAIAIAVELEREPPVAVNAAIVAVSREALTNAVKHASARRVQVRLTEDERAFVLAIEDDGVGLPGDDAGGISPSRVGGFGIVGMRERVVLAGGEFGVGPGADRRGTRVTARLPRTEPARVEAT